MYGASDLVSAALRKLPASRCPRELLTAAVELVVPAVGSWCLADLMEQPDLVTRVAIRGVDGPLHPSSAMGDVDARRSSALALGALRALAKRPQGVLRLSAADIEEATRSADPRMRAQGDFAASLDSADVVVLGLASRDKLLGVLTVGRTGEVFSDAQVRLLVDLALLLGVLLDSLRLTEVQRSVSAAMQTCLLPPLPLVSGLTLAARYVPADDALQVGGDWYDVFPQSGGTTALVIGDVTGHNVQAAARMAEVRNLLRACAVNSVGGPAATLADLDRMTDHLGLPASATCLYAQVIAVGSLTWELTWSCAGHLPPVLLRDGTASLLPTEPDLMLGVDVRVPRTEQRATLQPGDLLLLMTDGLVEKRRVSLDERLTVLTSWLTGNAHLLPEEMADQLLAQLPQGDDDIALLLVRFDGQVDPQDHGELALTAEPQSARRARVFVGEYLTRWGLKDLSDAVVLLVSELVTNALLHSRTASFLTITRLDGTVRVTVSDGSSVGPKRRRRSEQATTGRGLQLLEDLSDEWDWEETVLGKTIWFLVSNAHDPWAVLGETEWLAELDT